MPHRFWNPPRDHRAQAPNRDAFVRPRSHRWTSSSFPSCDGQASVDRSGEPGYLYTLLRWRPLTPSRMLMGAPRRCINEGEFVLRPGGKSRASIGLDPHDKVLERLKHRVCSRLQLLGCAGPCQRHTPAAHGTPRLAERLYLRQATKDPSRHHTLRRMCKAWADDPDHFRYQPNPPRFGTEHLDHIEYPIIIRCIGVTEERRHTMRSFTKSQCIFDHRGNGAQLIRDSARNDEAYGLHAGDACL